MKALGLAIDVVTLDRPMAREHAHFDIEINFVLAGGLTLFSSGGYARLDAGSAALFWAACLHRIVSVDEGTRLCWVTVPPRLFFSWRLPPRAVQFVLSGGVLIQPGPSPRNIASGDPAACARWQEDLSSQRAQRVSMMQEEVRLRLLRLADSASASPGFRVGPTVGGDRKRRPRARAIAPAGALHPGVEAMARCIAEHHASGTPGAAPLSAEAVARAAGLHPRYASGLFRAAFGTGLKEHLARQRVSTAQRLLLSTDLPVLEVAYRSGFESPGRFHEWFRRVVQMTPRHFRRLHLQG